MSVLFSVLGLLGWVVSFQAPKIEKVQVLTNVASPPPSFQALKQSFMEEEGKSLFFSRPKTAPFLSVEKIETHLKPHAKTKEYRVFFRKPLAWIRSDQGLSLSDGGATLMPVSERALVHNKLPVLSETPLALLGLSSFTSSRLAEKWQLQSLEVTKGGYLSILKSLLTERYLELRLSAARLENPGTIWLELETALQYFDCHQLKPRLLWMDLEGQITVPGQLAWTKRSQIK